MIVSPYWACGKLLLRPDIHCMPLHSPQCCDKAMASCIFGLQAHMFFLY